jgi:histidinol-phosphate aminotransferase
MGGDQLIQGAYLIAGGYERKALIFEPAYPMVSHAAKFNQTWIKRGKKE